MIIGTTSLRPAELSVGLGNGQVIDAGKAQGHQAILVEFPVFIAIAAKPLAVGVLPLIGKAYGDPVRMEGPDLLDQPILDLTGPFAGQESLDLGAAARKFGPIAPETVGRIGQSHTGRIAAVPRVFRHPRLLSGGLGGEGRQGRARRDGQCHDGAFICWVYGRRPETGATCELLMTQCDH